MATNTDRCVTLVPYFDVNDGQLDAFKAICPRFVAKSETEPKCLHYAFSFNGQQAHCREGYTDADGVLHHLQNVDAELKEALALASITRLEVHGPAEELDKLRGPLAALNPAYFTVEYGFRR